MTEAIATDPARRDRRALLSGYAYLALAGTATLLLSPLYLRLLGTAAWGEVAFCLSVQGVLFGLDALLGPLVLREAAQAASPQDARAVLRVFLRRYARLALGLFLVLQVVLATSTATMPTLLLRVALLQFLFQFTNLAIVGYWQGRGAQPRANARLAFFLAMKHGGAFALILAWRAEAIAFLLAFALVAALELGCNLLRVRRDVRASGDEDRVTATAAAPLSIAFAVAGLSSMLGAHLDRLWLAAILPSSRFGIYFLLGSLLLSLLHLQVPIQRAFLPRIAADATPQEAVRRMRRTTAIVWLPALGLALASAPFLRIWLGAGVVDDEATLVFSGLMLAAIAMTLASPAQALLLREARYRALAAINLAALALQVVLLASLAPAWGMRAGAAAWLGAALVQWIGAEAATRRR